MGQSVTVFLLQALARPDFGTVKELHEMPVALLVPPPVWVVLALDARLPVLYIFGYQRRHPKLVVPHQESDDHRSGQHRNDDADQGQRAQDVGHKRIILLLDDALDQTEHASANEQVHQDFDAGNGGVGGDLLTDNTDDPDVGEHEVGQVGDPPR